MCKPEYPAGVLNLKTVSKTPKLILN